MIDVREAITQAHHEDWARVVAALARRFGDLDVAEEAAAEARQRAAVTRVQGAVSLWLQDLRVRSDVALVTSPSGPPAIPRAN